MSKPMNARPSRLIAFVATGSYGDVLPMIEIAKACQSLGHDAVVFANPLFAQDALRAGIGFVPVGCETAYAQLLARLATSSPAQSLQHVSEHLFAECPAIMRAIEARVELRRSVLVGGPLTFSTRLLGELHRVATATVHYAPIMIRSAVSPARLQSRWPDASSALLLRRLSGWLADRLAYRPYLQRPLNRLRVQLGLAPVADLDDWMRNSDRNLALFPSWFAPPQSDWPPIDFCGFALARGYEALSEETRRFLANGPAPVAITTGTANLGEHKHLMRMIEACRRIGRRALVLSLHAPPIPSAPDLLQVAYEPFASVLPHVAGIVHHGGIGTIAHALAAGTTQLIRPQTFDQFDNARHAVALGAAIELPASERRATAVAESLAAALSGPVRARTAQLSSVVRNHDGARAAALSLVATGVAETGLARHCL